MRVLRRLPPILSTAAVAIAGVLSLGPVDAASRNKPAVVYRGVYVDPHHYEPTRAAGRMVYESIGGRLQLVRKAVPEIWFASSVENALSYAAGEVTQNLAGSGGRRLRRTLVLELEVPSSLAHWEDRGMGRGWFSRKQIPDDRARLRRVGIVHLAGKPPVGAIPASHGRWVEWLTVDQFNARYPRGS